MKGTEKRRKGEKKSQQGNEIVEVEKRFDNKLDKVMGIVEKLMAKVTKDKKVIEGRHGKLIF